MTRTRFLNSVSVGSLAALLFATGAMAETFTIPPSDLKTALDEYTRATGVDLIYPDDEMRSIRTAGVKGDLSPDGALSRLLKGTGFAMRHEAGGIAIVHQDGVAVTRPVGRLVAAASASSASSIESVVVTSSKIKGDIQTVPIAITALSQEQLTSRQIAGGPDLVKEVPNLTFSKTNFTGYNIQIRGIGTQAISVTTDPAVAVAFNDVPFIRNHFFEQEFYDVSQVEVLRGPQGTLYGRNATAGVVNVISAKPTDQFEAMASADVGNYNNRRFEGMVNVPIIDDRLDLRVAGEWTKRDGYSFNTLTSQPIDGRDLWSSRVSLGVKPIKDLQATLVWEHFQENDDRLRSSKQLCKTDHGPSEVGGAPSYGDPFLSQGCLPTSLYGADAFEVVNGYALPYFGGLVGAGFGLAIYNPLNGGIDPYASVTQSRNLRVIESALDPHYRAKNDIVELNADYTLTPELTFTSQTAYNHDFLWSTEDYNRFNTRPGIFLYKPQDFGTLITPNGMFCDPQLGCSDRLVAQDLSAEHAWQLSQEFRLASSYEGPLNFSVGANYLHYETNEDYYVFFNTLTMYSALHSAQNYQAGVSDNTQCLKGLNYPDPQKPGGPGVCSYIDPNPLNSLNNKGHNYFLSQNPYVLNSWAGFGEAYFNVTNDLKLIGGLRWTDDEKHFIDIPSEILVSDWGYPSTGIVDQKWNQWTGRFTANWTPKLDFTDQSLVYGSFAHGYKAGGANPPGAVLLQYSNSDTANPVHPPTFKPEFVDAYELGTKNTLLDGNVTLNGDVFYYNYKAYQISEIVDRSAVNLNFDAKVKGAELETTWEPAPGLKLSFAGGYEDARLAKGSQAVDLMDRTAGNPNWVVVKPFVTQASNCILPVYVISYQLLYNSYAIPDDCGVAYGEHFDPVTGAPYVENPTGPNRHGDPIPPGLYAGFDPLSVDPTAPADVNMGLGLLPTNGAGIEKNVSNNELPNAPHFTTSLTAEYTMPMSDDWAATLHSDFYWQSQSFARVFNDRPYDKIRGYSNLNLALIFTGANGWQVLGYLKNVFDTTAITGDFLNSDDTGLTTNVFLTDPRLYGIRLTKNF